LKAGEPTRRRAERDSVGGEAGREDLYWPEFFTFGVQFLAKFVFSNTGEGVGVIDLDAKVRSGLSTLNPNADSSQPSPRRA